VPLRAMDQGRESQQDRHGHLAALINDQHVRTPQPGREASTRQDALVCAPFHSNSSNVNFIQNG
jgi:hypothetical protein